MILTNPQLDSLCLSMSSGGLYYYPQTQQYLNALYCSGCRTNELQDASLWTALDIDHYTLTPLKGNNTRDIINSGFTGYFYNWTTYKYPHFVYITQRQISFDWKRYLPYTSITIGNKDITQYLWRYNYIRKMHDSGKTNAEIITQMGWTNPSILTGYLSNNIIAV